jgi:uncharacterized membrane protein YeiH
MAATSLKASPSARTGILPALAYGLDLLGVAVFAVSGALAGIHRGLDLFGVAVLGAVAGVGGGTLRDVLLNRKVFWIADPKYLYTILLATGISIAFQDTLPDVGNALLVADAFGLSLCALSGAQITEAEGHAWIVVVLLGTMSGVAGGVLRDLLSGVVPLLLRRDIYATAAIAGICVYLLLQATRLKRSWAFLLGIATVIVVRLFAVALGWQLPVFAKP